MATTKATNLGHRSDVTLKGTTTTVDSNVVVSDTTTINNAGDDVGLKINSESTGHIMQLQDSGTDVMVVKDGGNVGLNVTTPGQKLSVDVNSSNTTVATFDGIEIGNSNTTANNGTAISFSYGAGGASYAKIGAIHEDRSSGSEDTHLFFTTLGSGSHSEKMRIDSDGDVTVNTGNLVIGSAGHGITFQASTHDTDSAGTGSHNTLDDYEEGTFTLTGKNSSNVTQFTATNQVYQKIGNRCFIEIYFTGGSTNGIKLEGLPFPASGQTWAPNSKYLDIHTYINNGNNYINWNTSTNAGHAIRMQFSYRTT